MSKARQLADLGNVYDDGALSHRNMVVNGAMQVAVRGDSTGINSGGLYGPDRMRYVRSGRSSLRTISQFADGPDDFTNCYKIVCDAGAAPSANDINWLEYRFEGQDVAHLNYGSSTAKTVTLSFWVKSNVTGVYTTRLQAFNASVTRMITQGFTVSSADTWEYITVQFSGDADYSFYTDNTEGLRIAWLLGGGSSRVSVGTDGSWIDYDGTKLGPNQTADVFATTNNYFQITGVSLEVGDTATPFEHRSYGDELARCQRYFYKHYKTQAYENIGNASTYNTINTYLTYHHPVRMRANPTVTVSAASDFYITGNASDLAATGFSVGHASPFCVQLNFGYASGITNGYAYWIRMGSGGEDASKYLQADAEL